MDSVVLIEGAEIGQIPPTPLTPSVDLSSVAKACALLKKISRHFGTPTGYKQEQNGRLIHSITPDPQTEYIQISSSSKTELQLHTETAFHPFKPSHILLMCLRGDQNAYTTYALVDEIVKELDEWTINQLSRNAFLTSIDESFRQNGEQNIQLKTQILKKLDTGYEMRFDEFFMEGIDDDAKSALISLRTIIPKLTKSIALKTGDVLILNNKKTIHGRKPFQPRYDGTDRWVLRTLVVDECPPMSQQIHDDHMIITTDFTQETTI